MWNKGREGEQAFRTEQVHARRAKSSQSGWEAKGKLCISSK